MELKKKKRKSNYCNYLCASFLCMVHASMHIHLLVRVVDGAVVGLAEGFLGAIVEDGLAVGSRNKNTEVNMTNLITNLIRTSRRRYCRGKI